MTEGEIASLFLPLLVLFSLSLFLSMKKLPIWFVCPSPPPLLMDLLITIKSNERNSFKMEGVLARPERDIERLGEGEGEGEVQIKVVPDDAGILRWDSLILWP